MLDGARALGVEEDHLSLARARRLQERRRELRDAGRRSCMGLRERKDAEELAAIRRACAVVVEVMERMFAGLRVGDVEREVNARVAFELASAGATESHPLILFGPNASRPARAPGDRGRSRAGDVVCADVSARIDGYWADLTRCATVGPPSDWARAPGRSCATRRRRRSRRRASAPPAQRRRRRAARDRRGAPAISAPACTARATRSAPRSTSRRSSCPAATRRWRRGTC